MTNASRRHMTWRWLAVMYIAALHALAVTLIVKTDFIPKVKVKLGLAAPTPSVHLPNMRRIHTWMDESVPDNAVIFLGDSIVQGLATAAVVPDAVNYGIATMNAAQLGDLLPAYKAIQRTRIIVLSVGINDVILGESADLPNRYKRILNRIPHTTPLIWSAIAPTRFKQPEPQHIRSANQVIATLCEQRGNCTFVDTWALLAGEGGLAIDGLLLDDNVHFSAAAYAKWIAALQAAINAVPCAMPCKSAQAIPAVGS